MTTPSSLTAQAAEVAQLQKLTKDDLIGFQGAVFQRILRLGKAALRLNRSTAALVKSLPASGFCRLRGHEGNLWTCLAAEVCCALKGR